MIRIKPIKLKTVNHRLLMFKITYINNMVTESPITQITYISTLTDIQLMLLVIIK